MAPIRRTEKETSDSIRMISLTVGTGDKRLVIPGKPADDYDD